MDPAVNNFLIDLIKREDIDDVVEFVNTYYCKDEPIAKSVGTFQNEEVYGYLSGFLDSGFCHKALNPETKEIIAVSFSKEITPDDPELDLEDILSPAVKAYASYFHYFKSQYNLFKTYDCTKIYEGHVGVVHPNYRHTRIGTDLLLYTLDFAKEKGFSIMAIVSSNKYTEMGCLRQGFECVYRLPHSEYIVDGKTPIIPETPHIATAVFVKKL